MTTLPSKELLSNILELKVEKINVDGNILNYEYSYIDYQNGMKIEEREKDCINIYELTHKCKEWAFSKGYTVETYKKIKQERPITFIKIYCNNSNKYIKEYELAKTETFEADIRACELIMEQTK